VYCYSFIKKYSESLIRLLNKFNNSGLLSRKILKEISLKICYFIITYWN